MREKFREESFASFLENEVVKDLATATKLTSIPKQERTHEQKVFIDLLKGKYAPEGECPSHLFPFVSKKLQEEYNTIHKKICKVLYFPFY